MAKRKRSPFLYVYIYAAVILIGNTIPTSHIEKLSRLNKFFRYLFSNDSLHFFLFGFLAWLLCFGYYMAGRKKIPYVRIFLLSWGYGILIEGRDRPPVLLCGHTLPYYLDFVRRFGFEEGRPQNVAFESQVVVETEAFKRLHRIADRVRSLNRFTIRTPDFSRWEDELDPLLELMNTALAHLEGHIPWQRETLRALLAPFKEFADPELILFAEEDGKMIGFFPGVPNLNETMIHANGLRYPWDYLKAWWHMRRQPDCLTIKSVLVPPEHWGNGVAVLMFDEMLRRVQAKGYKWVDLSLTAIDNPRTPMLAERIGARVYKRYQIFRYWFKD